MNPPRPAPASAALAAGFVALLAAPFGAHAQSPADRLLCQMASEAAATANAAGPAQIDPLTTQESVEVTCDTKTILARFSRKDSSTAQPEGWQDAWQDKLDGAYCGDPATREVIAGGWTLAESTTFTDGVVFEIKATCE